MSFLYPDNYALDGTRGADDPRWHATMFRTSQVIPTPGGRIFRPQQTSGVNAAPTEVQLWNVDTATKLLDFDAGTLAWPTTNAQAWVSFSWSGSVDLQPGVRYAVLYRNAINSGWAYQSGAPAMPPAGQDFLYSAIGPVGSLAAYTGEFVGTLTNPGSQMTWYSDHRNGADVFLGAGTVPESQPVNAALADWLDTATGTQANSAPLKTQALAEGANGFAAIKAVADAIASIAAGLPGTIVGGFTTVTGQLTSMTSTITGQFTSLAASLADDLVTINGQFDTLLGSLAGRHGGGGSFPSDAGTLVWAMTDETDFAGAIAWAVPADLYVFTLTTLPTGSAITLIDGVETVFRVGWWCPLNGQFARQRTFVDFVNAHLEAGSERMPGVLVSLQPGGEGHLQAWVLS